MLLAGTLFPAFEFPMALASNRLLGLFLEHELEHNPSIEQPFN